MKTLYITLSVENGLCLFQATEKDGETVLDNKRFWFASSDFSALDHTDTGGFMSLGRRYYNVPDDCDDIIINNQGGNTPSGVVEYVSSQLGYPI